MGVSCALTGAELARRARGLLADIHEQQRQDALWRRRFAAERRWQAQRQQYACDHRLASGPDESADAFWVQYSDDHAVLVANWERVVATHAAWHQAERVNVQPTVGWRQDAVWQGGAG